MRDIKGEPGVVRVEEQSPNGQIRHSKLIARRATMRDEFGGLQRFLFEWLGWPRESVLSFRGTESEVYLENVAPLFYIDQDEGWTDLQALQISRYGQYEIAEVAVEYLLGALDAIQARVNRQSAILKEATLHESARGIAERVTIFTLKHGWNVDWSGHGSIEEILARWSLRGLREVLLQEADVDLGARRKALENQAEALRRALTSDPIDATDASTAPAVSQKVVDLKRRRHALNEELGSLRTQYDQTSELVSSLEHRTHSATDVLRFKTIGVGRLDHVECPTCHRIISLDGNPVKVSVEVNKEKWVDVPHSRISSDASKRP